MLIVTMYLKMVKLMEVRINFSILNYDKVYQRFASPNISVDLSPGPGAYTIGLGPMTSGSV